jgi:hypothetical protein
MGQRWQIALLAMVLAVFSWYLVSGREKVESWIQVPVEMTNPPASLFIRKGGVNKLEVRVRGPKGIVRSLAGREKPYTLNLSGLTVGENTILFEDRNLKLPKSLEVVEIKPNRVQITADRIVTQNAAVSIRYAGQLSDDYRILTSNATPATVTLRGPESMMRRAASLDTKGVVLPAEPPAVWSAKVGLRPPAEDVEVDPVEVTVNIAFGLKTKALWLRLPVAMQVAGAAHATLLTKHVGVLVEGPVSAIRNLDLRKDVEASLTIPANVAQGKHTLPYKVSVPQGLTIKELSPPAVEVQVHGPGARKK